MWSSENAGSILDFAGELELWTRAGKIKKAVRRPAARHADRHVRTGGSRSAGDAPPRRPTHTATYAGAPCVRASISGGVGHVH